MVDWAVENLKTVFQIIGSLLIAIPVTFYAMKRAKLVDSEGSVVGGRYTILVSDYEKRIKSMDEQLAAMESRLDRRDKTIETLQGTIGDLKKTVDDLGDVLRHNDRLRGRVAELEAKVINLEQTNTKQESEIHDLTEQLRALESKPPANRRNGQRRESDG